MSYLSIYKSPQREVFEVTETLLQLRENPFRKLISYDLTLPLPKPIIDDLFLNLGVKPTGFSLDCDHSITVKKC